MSQFYVRLLLLVVTLCFGFSGKSQQVDLVLQVADNLYSTKDYYGSILFYEKAMNIDSANAEVLYKYAKNLAIINSHEKASRYFLKAYLIDRGRNFPTVSYDLAEAYRSSGEYRKAKKYYNVAIRPYRRERESYWYKKIEQNKESAAWAYKNQSTITAKPNNIGKVVNTTFAEFGATQNEEYFYFSAMIADSVEENNRVKDKEYFSRIYIKSLSNSRKAKEVEFDSKSKLIIQQKHIANPALFKDELYFSVCDTNFQCEIWSGRLNKDKVSGIKKLNNNVNYPTANNTQPHLVEIDETVHLFFVSNRENGIGGLDIWMAKKENFGFDEAINLGTVINTPDNEITPFYNNENKTLNFSSDWHSGYGGYDIFKSEGKPIQFESVENIGFGINSAANEYYFQPNGNIATFSSNRMEGNTEKSSSCCNDLFEVVYNTTPSEFAEDSPAVVQLINIELLNKFLPLNLFFHNDQPNPNSRDTTTNANYLNLIGSYSKMKEEYQLKYGDILPKNEREEAMEDLASFFDYELNAGLEELKVFTPLLIKELQKGSNIALTIKGFASSVSESDYNLNLTLRRIESLINYFESVEGGKLKPYLNGEAVNGGTLKINKVPYGEYAVKQEVEEDDKITAVYSPIAVKQRKIEIVAVTNTNPDSQINLEEQARVSFNSKGYNLGSVKQGDEINRFFNLKNTGGSTLKIYNISANCDCVSLDYPTEIAKGEVGKLLIRIDTKQLEGDASIQLLVVSNTIPNLNELKIEFSVQP